MFFNKLPLLPLLVFLLLMSPFSCTAQNVFIRPNFFGPEKDIKQSDVCLYAARQTQMCLQMQPPKCRELADLIAQFGLHCAPLTMAPVSSNATSPFLPSYECSAADSTFKILFIISIAAFILLLAIGAIGAIYFLHFRQK